ncbi:MAG: hypothetical protein ACT4QD_07045, partial [Acidobacteriota bacterium]
MSGLSSLPSLVADLAARWNALDVASLQYWHRDTGRLALFALVALTALLLAWRLGQTHRTGRDGVVLPGLLSRRRSWSGAWVRHIPFIPFAAGLSFLLLAIADPYS